jgi:ferredoxin
MSPPDPAVPTAKPPSRRRLLPVVSSRCTGCGRCVGACGPHVLWLEAQGWTKSAVLHQPEGCTGCSQCAVVCPFDAIQMQERLLTARSCD